MHLCLGTTPAVQVTMTFGHLTLDEVNRAAAVRYSASGKSINSARVLWTLDQPVMVCVPAGGDTGRFLRSDLDAVGIRQSGPEVQSPTRICVSMIESAGRTATELVAEPGPLSAGECNALQQEMQSLLPQATMLLLSGSLAPGVSEDFYADCCRAASAAGVPVLLDARGEELKRALPLHPKIVKHNRRELAHTTGLPVDDSDSLCEAIRALQRMGPAWVIVTLGRDGAIASDGKSFWAIPALKIDPVSAIGSGDAFAAGLSAAVAAGQSVPDACRLAAACAAANALIPGAGFLRREDIDRLLKETRANQI